MVFMRDAIVSPLFDAEGARSRARRRHRRDRSQRAIPFYSLYHDGDPEGVVEVSVAQGSARPRATVLKATVAQMQTIQHRYYVPNNSALVVTGDVTPPTSSRRPTSSTPTGSKGRRPVREVPARQASADQEDRGRRRRAAGAGRRPAVHAGTARRPSGRVGRATATPADTLGTALAEPSSRFQKALVDSGACVGVGIGWYTQMNTGPITLGVRGDARQGRRLRHARSGASSRR